MSLSLLTILRPPLPGEEFGEGQTRLNLKKTYLSILELPSNDELDYAVHTLDELRLAISIWLLSDQELYFLQAFTDEDIGDASQKGALADKLACVVTMHNMRKTLSWIRSELKIRYRLNHVLKSRGEAARGSSWIIGQYRYRKTDEIFQPQFQSRLETLLDEVDEAFVKLFYDEVDSPHQVVADEELMADCQKFGAELSGVSLVRMKEYGVGFVAEDDLKAGSKLISLSENKLVNIYQALASSFHENSGKPNSIIDGQSAGQLHRSESFMWAVLLGGRLSNGQSLIPPDSEAANILAPFYTAYVAPDFFMEEQLILILYLALESLKGPQSDLYFWLRNLQGYENCEVDAGNLLISKYREDVAQFLGEESSLGPIVESTRCVRDCIEAWYGWMKKFLAPVFPELLGEALDGGLTVERLMWACWICESREFESPIPAPICFFNHLPRCNLSNWKDDALVRSAFEDHEDSCCSAELTVTSSSDVEDLSTLPNLQYLSQQAFGGTSKQRKQVRLPICLGWREASDGKWESVIELCDFNLSLKLLTLVPIVDFINHSDKAQCPHPGFHDLESRQRVHQDQAAVSDLLEPVSELTFANNWDAICQLSDLASRRFVLHTQTRVEQSKQVFINYGPHDGWSFLRYYGFASTEAENISLILSPEIRFEPDSQDYKTRSCMMKVFKVPEEHVLNKNGLYDVMMAACRILVTEDIRGLLNSHTQEQIRKFIYFCDDPQINVEAQMLLANILSEQSSYVYDCQKYAELCDLAISPDRPGWYDLWGEQLFTLFHDRKAIVERIIARILDQLSDHNSEFEN